jgi:CheY-like chemotaxis protein
MISMTKTSPIVLVSAVTSFSMPTKAILEAQGWMVQELRITQVQSFTLTVEKIAAIDPALVLSDLNYPQTRLLADYLTTDYLTKSEDKKLQGNSSTPFMSMLPLQRTGENEAIQQETELLNLGADMVLFKPISPYRLVARVEALMRRSSNKLS